MLVQESCVSRATFSSCLGPAGYEGQVALGTGVGTGRVHMQI